MKQQKYLMGYKHKFFDMAVNYFEQLIILVSAITVTDSISTFTSIVPVIIGIASSTAEFGIVQ